MDDLVVIGEVAGELQAQILKGFLEAEGIEAILSQESAGRVYGLTVSTMGVVQILVRADHAERAAALWKEYETGQLINLEQPEDETSPEEEKDS